MASDWAVMFVQATSPGAVFRFIERRRHSDDTLPEEFLLSEPVAPQGWRVLTMETIAKDSLIDLGESLSGAFSPSVILLFRSGEEWGHAVWQNGEVLAEFKGELPETSTLERLLGRLPGLRSTSPPYIEWARGQGLPVNRLPGLSSGIPIVSYRTVATLDERNLLIENSPRLYRFSLK